MQTRRSYAYEHARCPPFLLEWSRRENQLTHPENVVPKSTPTMSRSLIGAGSLAGSLTGPLMASVDAGGV